MSTCFFTFASFSTVADFFIFTDFIVFLLFAGFLLPVILDITQLFYIKKLINYIENKIAIKALKNI